MTIAANFIYAAIICPNHGQVDLTYAQYIKQMQAAHLRWQCPKCGLISEFDEDRYEQLLEERDLTRKLEQVGKEPDSPFDEVAGQTDPEEDVP